MKKWTFSIIIIIILCFNPLATSADFDNLPAKEQIKLILTTLRYNSTFLENLNKEVKIGLFCIKSDESKKYENTIIESFERYYKDKTFYNHKLNIKTISTLKELEENNFDAILIGPDANGLIEKILEISRTKNIVSTTGVSKYLNSGITVVVGIKDGKSFLGINLNNAKRENCNFNPRILKLALLVNTDD